jgi:hypothetical protein
MIDRLRAAGGLARAAGLATALAAGGVLLFTPAPRPEPPGPQPAALVWPAARRAVLPADLPDGTAFTPETFADARTAVGTAPTPDGKFLRLLVRQGGGTLRELRRLPMTGNPSVAAVAAEGTVLAWVENAADAMRVWTADLAGKAAARQLTADTGAARFYQSQYDLLIAEGRVHWAGDAPDGGTEIRSVALAGGPVAVRTEPGTWQLSAWPWLVDGVAAASGATTLRNLTTRQDVRVAAPDRSVTNCSPTWCRVVSFDDDGFPRIELMHPDGSQRREVATGEVETQLADVAIMDRFEVYAKVDANATLTGNAQILLYEIATRRTVEISPDASGVEFHAGVLWWTTGTQESFVRHALDLRTI